jgi:alkylglycerol monooxygenase
METYGKILMIATPIFFCLVLFEKWYGWRRGKETVASMDMIASLSSGITNATKDVLHISIGIVSYIWLMPRIALFHINNVFLTYLVTFILIDFAGYWVHRWSHVINLFWNRHIIHHSSEEFNLACALRQSISSLFELFTFMLLPAALVGVPWEVIATVAPLHLFAQFWYHTQHINRMGWLEKVIVTPSHHRVHHAINPEYMDKNLGQILIIWDKWFGTFQEELAEKPPVYGITRPVRTWNPIKINFQHLWLMIQDAWRTKNWKDKFTLWFRRTGYRPADVAAKYPVYKIENAYHFEKYQPHTPPLLRAWSWIQMITTLLLISYLFGNIALINNLNGAYIYLYGAFVFLSVYAYTELMDRNAWALYWEVLKNAAGAGIIFYYGDWFGSDALGAWIKYVLLGYFAAATVVTSLIVIRQRGEGAKAQTVAAL